MAAINRDVILITGFSYLVGAGVTLFITEFARPEDPELSLAVGAILGTTVGTVVHFRQVNAKPTLAAKSLLGLVLALCAVGFGSAVHFILHPFKYADVSILISVVGSFLFPFALFNTMWNAMAKARSNPTHKT